MKTESQESRPTSSAPKRFRDILIAKKYNFPIGIVIILTCTLGFVKIFSGRAESESSVSKAGTADVILFANNPSSENVPPTQILHEASEYRHNRLLATTADIVIAGQIDKVEYDDRLTSCFHTRYTVQVLWYSPRSQKREYNKARLFILQESGPLSNGSIMRDHGVPIFRKGDRQYLFLCNVALRDFIKNKPCSEQATSDDFSLLGAVPIPRDGNEFSDLDLFESDIP